MYEKICTFNIAMQFLNDVWISFLLFIDKGASYKHKDFCTSMNPITMSLAHFFTESKLKFPTPENNLFWTYFL